MKKTDTKFLSQKNLLRIMKIYTLLLFVTMAKLFAFEANGQSVTINVNNAELKTVFTEIESKTDFNFFYNNSLIDASKKVSLIANNQELDLVLVDLFKGTEIDYRLFKNQIVLFPKNDTSVIKVIEDLIKNENLDKEIETIIKDALQNEVKGIVLDAGGLPLAGVNIILKGTSTGTQSNFDGEYSIQVNKGDVLEFSYIGFKTQSITIGDSNTINVTMEEDASKLDEVVITALGITKQKKSLSYATQNVKTDELTQARSLNVVNSLSGKVAGISVTTGGSGVGSASKVLLRGNRSIGGSSEPLYVVDGIILNGDISNISPDDIQEISVLKGANAAALYGSRASNGAIIVTTKSGKGSRDGITTNLGFTFMSNTPIILTDFQNQYGQGSAGVYAPAALTSWGPEFDGSQVAHWSNNPNFGTSTYAYSAAPDNVKDFFRTGTNMATNLSVNIKKDESNTFFSYTHTDASGIIPNNDLDSHNLSARVNAQLSDKLSLDTKVNYIRQDFSNVLAAGEDYDNPLRYLYILPRNIRTQDIAQYSFKTDVGQDRQHYFAPYFNGGGNPYWTVNNITRPRLRERVIGMFSLKYQIADGLSIIGRSAIDRTSDSEQRMWHNDTYTRAVNGRYQKTNRSSYEWNTDGLLNYHKDLSDDFTLDTNFGANQRIFKEEFVRGDGSNFQIENLFALSNTTNPVPTELFSEKRVHSIYWTGELSYKNAIFLNASARNDWSSTLPSNNRSYFYPSFGLTAVVSDLVELPEAISYLKLRGSWAEVGNDTDPYQLFQQASVVSGSTININNALPNPDLLPETTRSTEIGFDVRLLDNKLNASLTWYKTNTFDQLFRTPVGPAFGAQFIFQNGADIQNTGIEINLGGRIINNEDFSWDANFNFAANKSKVLDIAEGFDQLTQSTDFIRAYRLVVGEEFGNVYSRGFARDDQGRVIVDAAGLPTVTSGLSVKIANFNPDWLGGFSNTFRYKDFSLSVLIDIRQGGTIATFTEAILAGNGLLDYTANGRDGSLVFGENVYGGETAVTATGQPNTISVSSEDLWNRLGGRNTPVGEAFVRDASNIRLREMVLGYSVPANVIEKFKFLTSARVSLVGRNLFFFSNKANSIDPESVTSTANDAEGREAFAAPTTRSFGLSLNVGF